MKTDPPPAAAVEEPAPLSPWAQPAAEERARGWRRLRPSLARWGGSTFDALRVRDYRLLWQGNSITSMGFWMQQVAIGWLILDLTGSPFFLGVAGFCRTAPALVLAPIAGVLADRLNRRLIILTSQTVLFVVTALITFLIFSERITITHILIASTFHGIAIAVQLPARQALIPQVVGREKLTNALALFSSTQSLSRVIGPSVAGVIMGVAGVAWCLAFQSLAYLWAIGNVLQMRTPGPRRIGRASAGVFANLREGLEFCFRTKPLLFQLLLAIAPTVLAMPYMTLLPAFARDVYAIGPGGLGLLYAGMGGGALTGAVLLASRRGIRRKQFATVLVAIANGVFLIVLSVAPWLPVGLLALAAVGAAGAAFTTLNGSVIQELAPDNLRGRVSGIYLLLMGLMPLGTVPAGIIAAAWGAPVAVALGGGLTILCTLALLAARPQLRHA